MFPNLWVATKEYWRKLDQLEATYHKGEISLDQVNAKVAELRVELGQERRATRDLLNSWRYVWSEQREAIAGIALVGIIAYAWVVS